MINKGGRKDGQKRRVGSKVGQKDRETNNMTGWNEAQRRR